MNSSTFNSKTFWKRSSLFLGLFFILFVGVELVSRWFLKRFVYGTQQYEQSVHYFEQKADQVELLFCGDSELYYGIRPDQIQTSYSAHNFAFPAEGMIATYFKLKHYLEKQQCPQLKFIFLQFQPHSLDREKRFLLRGHGDFQRFIPLSTIFSIYGPKETLIQGLYHSHFLKFRSSLNPASLVGLWKRRHQPPSEQLFPTGYGESDGVLDPAKVQAEVEQKLSLKIEPDPTLLEYYQKTIELAERHKIQVYLLQIPNYLDVYVRDAEKTPQHQEYQQARLLNTTYERLRSKAPQLKIIRVSAEIFTRAHFRDVAHLNKSGVLHLAQYLGTLFSTLLPPR